MLEKRSAFHNMYTGVNKTLLDPVLTSAVEKVEQMYERTFRAALPTFLLCQACTALAKHGKHIN